MLRSGLRLACGHGRGRTGEKARFVPTVGSVCGGIPLPLEAIENMAALEVMPAANSVDPSRLLQNQEALVTGATFFVDGSMALCLGFATGG